MTKRKTTTAQEEPPPYGAKLPIEPAKEQDTRDLLGLVLGDKNTALALIAHFPTLREMERAGIEEIAEIAGLQQAFVVKAALDLGRRLTNERLARGESFTCSRQIWRAMRDLEGLEQEEFWILLLDSRNALIKKERVRIGTTNACPIAAPDILCPALRERARSIILVHNHPSGDPTPSHEDRAITEQIQRAAKICGIKILDHIVIGDCKFVSFADRGWITE